MKRWYPTSTKPGKWSILQSILRTTKRRKINNKSFLIFQTTWVSPPSNKKATCPSMIPFLSLQPSTESTKIYLTLLIFHRISNLALGSNILVKSCILAIKKVIQNLTLFWPLWEYSLIMLLSHMTLRPKSVILNFLKKTQQIIPLSMVRPSPIRRKRSFIWIGLSLEQVVSSSLSSKTLHQETLKWSSQI